MADPIVEELQLDISPALDSLTPLASALGDLSSSFSTELASALDSAFGTPIPGDQLVDTAPLTSAVETALTDATGQPLPIEGDTAPLDATLSNALDQPRDVSVDGDVGALSSAIDDAVGPQTVPVDADVSAAQSALGALDAEPIEIAVTADTSSAQDSLAELGSSATDATGGVDGLAGGVEALSGATGLAKGQIGELGGFISNIGPASAAAVSGGAAFTAFLGESVALAADAQAQNKRFADTFGVLADQVRQVDVGGLNISLADLGKQSGTTNADLEATASRLGALGKSAGATGPQIVTTTDQLLALGATVAVNNPRLGDAADVADKLSAAFVRGGKALVPYGISLSKAQIEQEALNETGKTSAADLTIYERVVAGATLATNQFGDSLGTKFQQGSQNAQVQLRAVRVELEEMLTAVGGPLLEPVVASMQALLPVAEETGTALGLLAQDIAPAFGALSTVLVPVAGALGLVSDGLRGIGEAEQNISAQDLIIIGGAIAAIAIESGAATIAVGALGVALTAMATNPIVLAVAAVALLGVAYERTHQGSEQAKVDTQELDKAFGAFGSGTASAKANLATFNTALDDYLRKELDVGKANRTGLDGALNLGLGYEDLAKILGGTTQQFTDFTVRSFDSAKATNDQIGAHAALQEVLLQGRDKLEANAHAALDAAVASGALTQEQADLAVATADGTTVQIDATLQTRDYITAVKTLTPEIERAQIAQEKAAQAASTTSPAYAELARQLAQGAIGAQTAQDALAEMNFTDPAAQLKILTGEIDSFVSKAVGALPTAGGAIDEFSQNVTSAFSTLVSDQKAKADQIQQAHEAFAKGDTAAFQRLQVGIAESSDKIKADLKTLADDQDPQRFADNLNKQAAQIAGFQANLETLVSEGFGRLAAELAVKGPEAAGGLASALASDESKAKIGAASLSLSDAATTNFDAAVRLFFPEFKGLGAEAGNQLNSGLSSTFNWVPPAKREVAAAEQTIKEHQGAIFAAALATGSGGSEKYKAGFKVSGPTGAEVEKARQVIAAAKGGHGTAAKGTAGEAADRYFQALNLPQKTKDRLIAAANVFGGQGRIDLANSANSAGLLVGSAFDHGVALGIDENTGRIERAAEGAADKAYQAAKKKLDAKSPSRVAMELGGFFTEGLALGITAKAPLLERASTKLATAATAAITAGFNDPATIAAAIGRLNALIAADNAAAAAAKTAADEQATSEAKAAEALRALQAFVSGAGSQLPAADNAISKFASKLSSALDQVRRETGAMNAAWTKFRHDVNAGAPMATIWLDRAAFDKAESQLAHTKALLADVSNPTKFITSLQHQNAAIKAFQADLAAILAQGNDDLAEELARAGPEAAAKLADALAKSPAKAALAEAAIEQGQAYSDAFTGFLQTNFADQFGTVAANAGASAGKAVLFGLNDALKSDTTLATTTAGLAAQVSAALPQAITLPVVTGSAGWAGSFSNTVPPIAVGPTGVSSLTFNLDLTVELEDGRLVNAKPITVVVPSPPPSRLTQRVQAEVSAG